MNTETKEFKWIMSENGLPQEGEQVIVTDGKSVWIDEIYVTGFTDDGQEECQWDSGWDWLGTAWMTLPPLPKWKKEGSDE